MKFVNSIDSITEDWLIEVEKSPVESNRTRDRAKAIRLSANGFNINQLSVIFGATRKTISTWINNWERYAFDSLIEVPRIGRKPIIDPSEYDKVIQIVKKEPRQIKKALVEINNKLGKSISLKTLKRILKKRLFWGQS